MGSRVPKGTGFSLSGELVVRVVLLIDGFHVPHSLKENPEHHKCLWLDFRTPAQRLIPKKETLHLGCTQLAASPGRFYPLWLNLRRCSVGNFEKLTISPVITA